MWPHSRARLFLCDSAQYTCTVITLMHCTVPLLPAAAPTACPEGPPTQPTDGQWNVSCAGIGINETCKANCTWGPVAAAAPTATCELRPNAYPATTGWSTAGTCNGGFYFDHGVASSGWVIVSLTRRSYGRNC
jgi:hypothetical protein